MIRIGPRKLVLIRSGGYAYAEIELDHSMHIVAANNVGKTTIVNALQYLYVDDERSMRFPENAEMSRRHYFGDEASMILYECQTRNRGRVVVGIRPLGPAQGHRYERYVYQGPYQMSDFIDADNMPISWDVIKDELTLRKLQVLQTKDLRGALTGRSGPVDLSIVPLRGGVDYPVFRSGFINLLRLTKITGADLKNFIIEICQGDGNFHPVIDITNEYAAGFEKAQAEQHKAQDLRHSLPIVQEICEAITAYKASSQEAWISWRAIAHSENHHEIALRAAIAANEIQRQDLERQSGMLKASMTTHTTTISQMKVQIGIKQDKIDEINTRTEKYRETDPIAIKGDAEAAGRHVTELKDSIMRSEGRSPVEIERDIYAQRKAIISLNDQIKRIDDTSMLDWLCERYTPEQIETVTRMINHSLLSLSVPAQLRIQNEQELAAKINGILAAVTNDIFDDGTVNIDLAHISGVDVGSRPDRKMLERQLIELNEKVKRLEADLLAAQDRQRQQNELNAAEARYRDLTRVLSELDRLADDVALLPLKKDELSKAEQDHITAQDASDKDRSELEGVNRYIKSTDDAIADDNGHLGVLTRLMRTVDACASVNHDDETQEPDLIPINAMQNSVTAYQRKFDQLHQLDDEIAKGRRRLAESMIALPIEHNALLERLESSEKEINSQIYAADKAWTSLVGSMTTSFKRLDASLETIRRRANVISNELRKVRISNLEGMKLKITENADQVRTLREFLNTRTTADDMFANPTAHQDASHRIQQMIGRGSWSIEDLFQVEIEVIKNGQARTYASIDKIESTGTGMTIKIVLGIMLLHGLLKIESMSIPFYIDEATIIDKHNLRQIIAFAEARGFVPILASPDATDCVHTYYFPAADENGVYIIPEHHRVVRTELLQDAE